MKDKGLDLKIACPIFKGKKHDDPNVHIQAFEQYAGLKHILEEEWGEYFPDTLKEAAKKWYYHYPASKLQAYRKLKKAFILEYTDDQDDDDDDDEDEAVDTEDQPGISRHHQGLDDDDNQDDPPSGIGPSTRGAANEPSNIHGPQSKPPLPAPEGNKGSQKPMADKMIIPTKGGIGVLTYKKKHKAIFLGHPKAAYQALEEYKQELEKEKQINAQLLKEKADLEIKLTQKDQLVQAKDIQLHTVVEEQLKKAKQLCKDIEFQLLHGKQAKEEQLKRAWKHKELIEQSIMNKYLLQTLQDISTLQGNITLKIADAQQWMNKVCTDLEDKAQTFTQALFNEVVVSYLGDLDNKSDEGDDDDDEDKADEDHEDPASPSGHPRNDDDNDDTDQSGTGPSGGTSTDPPPPSTSHTDPLASKGTDDHPQGTGATGEQQDTTALVTYKKYSTALVSSTSKEMAISTMVSSTGAEMAKSIAMVSSSKGKEKATIGSTDSFNNTNPWLHREFHLAKQVQLKEYLQADDMYSDMQRLAAFFIGIVEQIGDWWEKGEGMWKEWITMMNEIEQKKTVKEFRTAIGEFKASMRAWKHHMQVLVKHTNALLQLHIVASKIPEKQIENLASNKDTYKEIGEFLFEARIKANQLESSGWLAIASHCHKLARARVIKGKKTPYYPQTKEWLPMTPYEQQVLVKEPEVLEQTAVYRIIKKQMVAHAMEVATSPQQPVQPRERKPPDKNKGKNKK
ncbi:hypothetical protein L7F22_009568 [Adiantum nelumboides]|nr:hypothetical protein [Adiantum nelumboides]